MNEGNGSDARFTARAREHGRINQAAGDQNIVSGDQTIVSGHQQIVVGDQHIHIGLSPARRSRRPRPTPPPRPGHPARPDHPTRPERLSRLVRPGAVTAVRVVVSLILLLVPASDLAAPQRRTGSVDAAIPVHPSVPAPGADRTSVIGDPRTADPCALTDAGAFKRFGHTVLDRHYGNFDRCDVIVQPSEGPDVDIEVQLRKPGSFPDAPPGRIRQAGAVRVMESPLQNGECERTLLLPDLHVVSVRVGPTDHSADGRADLCAMADLATRTALGVIGEGELRRRTAPPDSLIGVNACLLLDASSLSALPGLTAEDYTAGYANWRCEWNSPATRFAVIVEFDQSRPLAAPWDGRPVQLGGSSAFVMPAEDDDGCLAQVVHRNLTDEQGGQVQEILRLEVHGPRRTAELCGRAKDLATRAAAELRG
ncbi:hypothetical protein ACPXCE_06725 [Streptomyces sp. DT24]|uniref:hypothetical protein n=1 Tax=unclassified Streptomyces TaxID=2593676 RepID=UPI003CF5147F